MRMRIKKLVIRIEMNIRAVALTTTGGAMERAKRETVFSPLRVERIEEKSIASVVVLTPPAVEPGDPPININNVMTYKV